MLLDTKIAAKMLSLDLTTLKTKKLASSEYKITKATNIVSGGRKRNKAKKFYSV